MKKIYIIFLLLPHFLPAQNIGINTSTPTEKLHVAGNIKVDTIKPAAFKLTTGAGAGKLLTSDAIGNASWQLNGTGSTTGNTGYGLWGDCATNGNIGEYQPVADSAGKQNDFFGNSVAVSGDFAIVGAFQDDNVINLDQGSASIYRFDGSHWVFMQKIMDPAGEGNDKFGISVAISGNFAIIGAYLDDVGINTDQGSACVFQFNGSNWVFLQKLTDANGLPGNNFGFSVSISGNYVLVGSPKDDVPFADKGSASFYQYTAGNWAFMSKIVDNNGQPGDNFGSSVCVAGSHAIVGASSDDVLGNTDQGSATIFQFNGSNWTFFETITDPAGLSGDLFGTSVGISHPNIIVGAMLDSEGITAQGSASFFHFNLFTWEFVQKVKDAAAETDSRFGYNVSMSGNYAIVGTPLDNVAGKSGQGSASVYQNFSNAWNKLQLIAEPNGEANDIFGIAVSVDGTTKRFLIGAHNSMSERGKAVFGKIN